MDIRTLLEQLPEETKTRVENAKKSFNLIIRDSIRFESRLSFNSGKNGDIGEENLVRVPIKIDTGYPEEILAFEIPKKFEFAALLSKIRPAIVQLNKSSKIVTDFICEYQEIDEISEFVGGAICYSDEEANKLLRIVDEYDFVKELVNINPNLLGCYKYNVHHNQHGYWEASTNREIYLYWAIIGIIASRLGVEVEALTAVVLSHELSHAYTHIGYDIDGNRWSDEGFKNSDLSVVEGLAQYYTERVLSRLEHKIPGGLDAYEKLLEKQNKAYKAHKIWIDEIKASSESIRETLIQIRNKKNISLEQFNELVYQNNMRKSR